MLILASTGKIILYKNTLGFFFLYCFIGLLSSLFMSPDTGVALYWGFLYLSPLLVVWVAQQQMNTLGVLSRIIRINYFVVFLIFASFIPQTIDMIRGRAPFTQFFGLPFGLGEVRINGVGRYALIVAIVAFVRLNFAKKTLRLFWLFFMGMALLMMAYTRSRTTLLGLAVVSFLFAYIQKLDWRFFFAGPVAAYVLWLSGYTWRAQQHIETLLNLTGRQYTWQRGLEQVARSPVFGWGFHADRIMLNSEHMHNSYLHAAIHSGIIGALLFLAGILSIWVLMIKRGLLKNLKYLKREDKPYLLESVLLVGYFTSRSFFESTAAFYGVDLLVFLPAAAYIIFWLYKHPDFPAPSS
jgi:O-antigen ligase